MHIMQKEKDYEKSSNYIPSMLRVIGIGETVLDILFKNDQPQKAVPGGSTFNSIVSLGRRITYTLIAQAEYRADRGYQPLIADFPEVASVAADETRHGDLVSGLLKKPIQPA